MHTDSRYRGQEFFQVRSDSVQILFLTISLSSDYLTLLKITLNRWNRRTQLRRNKLLQQPYRCFAGKRLLHETSLINTFLER